MVEHRHYRVVATMEIVVVQSVHHQVHVRVYVDLDVVGNFALLFDDDLYLLLVFDSLILLAFRKLW